MRRGALVLILPGVACSLMAGDAKVDFNRDVRPVLSDRCFTCHGPDEKTRMVNLRLDTREGAFADRGGYKVIVPGDPSGSRLYQRITHEQAALRMPPRGSVDPLTTEETETIRRWIAQGATWASHWAYQKPLRPELPSVTDEAWPKNPIDRFVLARLDAEGLNPMPEASRETLIRRATLDLTGLPPTPEEVDAFLADTTPDAYEKVIDRLLASPRYGERMAMEWLDLARYADTHGYHIDSHRDMWHWRDWVVDAFNSNMPFDQFTTEQLAGDLLPNATEKQLIATGFNRNHMINYEGGAIPEEYLVEYVVDRVEATSTVWLGMTMGCARCHDHKYDPISQKDFYRFFAFFNTVEEEGLDGRRGNAKPMLPLPSPEQKVERDRLTAEIEALEQAFPEEEAAQLEAEWRKARLASIPLVSTRDLMAHYEMDGSPVDTSGSYHHGTKVRGEITYSAGKVGRAATFSGETQFAFPGAGNLDRKAKFSIALWVRTSGKEAVPVLEKIDSSGHGWQLSFDDIQPLPGLVRGQHLRLRLASSEPDNALEVKTRELVVQGWRHVTFNYDGSGKARGVELFIDGAPTPLETVKDNLRGSIKTDAPLEIGVKHGARAFKGGIDDLRIYARQLKPTEIEQLAIHEPIRAILENRTPQPKKEKDREARNNYVHDYFLRHHAPEHLRKRHIALQDLRKRHVALDKEIPTTMVMSEMAKEPRETFVLGRGDYRNEGEKVTPGVPAALPPLPTGASGNRLGLARWLTDADHPLTARVTVNRFWQMHFGTGLVKTAEDFGSQGEAPSHPALLDWLATEFIRSGWDVKAIERLIVTSATYRQSSQVRDGMAERDPENRLLARGPRFRLKAETVRDNALAISGLLNGEFGGPSVFPYQPPGLWKDVAYGDYFTAQSYTPSHGEDLYRRSMYTFWKRTAPPPSLATFDAPDREKCTARRARTNTPLQALVLLNDPTYVEAARALAERMLREAGPDAGDRITHAFRLATARRPSQQERQVLRDIAEQQLSHYRSADSDPAKLLQVGESDAPENLDPTELAAWTTVASVILNLDETITKE